VSAAALLLPAAVDVGAEGVGAEDVGAEDVGAEGVELRQGARKNNVFFLT
jgi:hypothetical protein